MYSILVLFSLLSIQIFPLIVRFHFPNIKHLSVATSIF